ncbi:MAG: GNAT family N-acetyltransferase [Chloroflexi bacterium]|nr:GNAT family N-acetyltransferase [Chloroflexota bacterium]
MPFGCPDAAPIATSRRVVRTAWLLQWPHWWTDGIRIFGVKVFILIEDRATEASPVERARNEDLMPGADPSLQISPLPRSRVDEAGEVLARSFHDALSFRHVFPDPGQRTRALRPFFCAAVADALPYGGVYAALADDRVIGVAIWLPPGRYPLGTGRKLRFLPSLLKVWTAAPGSFRALARLGANVERAFPEGTRWYLEVVGVAEDARGRGVGHRLEEPVLDIADRDGIECYLETDLERNVAWYERLGFRVHHQGLQLTDGGPTHWSMIRRPVDRFST